MFIPAYQIYVECILHESSNLQNTSWKSLTILHSSSLILVPFNLSVLSVVSEGTLERFSH